jgi:hypothetical protein
MPTKIVVETDTDVHVEPIRGVQGGGSAKAMLQALRFPDLAEAVLQSLHGVLRSSADGHTTSAQTITETSRTPQSRG